MSTHDESDEHIHLPPNSWVPICVALALAFNFVSYLTFQYPIAGSLSWGDILVPVSALCLIASLVAWFRGARNEFRELPDSLDDH